jgi:predicted transcriptional regulator
MEHELGLLNVREARMLIRIEELKAKGMITYERETQEGYSNGREVQLITTREKDAQERIHAIEEALTKVQSQKHKLLDQLKKAKETNDDEEEEEDGWESLKTAIKGSRQ